MNIDHKVVYLFSKQSGALVNTFRGVKDAAIFFDVTPNDIYGRIHSGRPIDGHYVSYDNVWSDTIETFF